MVAGRDAHNMVVLPALSRPRIKTRTSLRPKSTLNILLKNTPILLPLGGIKEMRGRWLVGSRFMSV